VGNEISRFREPFNGFIESGFFYAPE